MPPTRDVVIIGGGHNGLVAAFYLARSGLRPLVLERRPAVGGLAVTGEIRPGFRCSTLAHAAGPLRPDVARDMALQKHGLRMIETEPRVIAPSPDGRALVLHAEPSRSAEAIARFSRKDAAAYPEFDACLGRLSGVINDVLLMAPPSIDAPSAGDLFRLLRTGRRFRALGRKDMFRLLRWGPMAVADLVAEWFETELLRATIAARGTFGSFLGPWSAGTGAAFLLRAASDGHAAARNAFAEGGLGALTQAMAAAARAAGAEIRTGADVARVQVKGGVAGGVVLSSGEEIPARAVVSNADPRRTLLGLVDPVQLEPDFVGRLRAYRCPGTVAKVNLALDGLPRFAGIADGPALLSGRIQIAPEIDYLERAFDDCKYGDFSRQPYLEVAIPSLSDPSLAPAGKHVMSIYVQFAPLRLREGDWNGRAAALGDAVVGTLARYAPGLESLVLERQIITPKDLEETYGLTGGHIFHGELALDQIFTMRPLLGWARYRTPVTGLYLCGSGTHPGTGLTGASGANAARAIANDLKR
jgi:phytoene dehydrogenase-like protein